MNKSHFNDAVTISDIQKITEKPTSIVMFKQFRKKKRSLHEANARKGRKTPNRTSKRNAKNTKFDKGFWLNDYVRIKNSHQKGYISGFTEYSCYIKNCLGNYVIIGKYKKTALSKLTMINHHNNWCSNEISAHEYVMK